MKKLVKIDVIGQIVMVEANGDYYGLDTIGILNSETNVVTLLAVFFSRRYEIYTYEKVTVRYFISDEKLSKNELIENWLNNLYGSTNAEHGTRHVSYSEYTTDIEINNDLRIGGHDLLAELKSHVGKFIRLEIEQKQ